MDTGSVYTSHSQEHSLSSSPRFANLDVTQLLMAEFVLHSNTSKYRKKKSGERTKNVLKNGWWIRNLIFHTLLKELLDRPTGPTSMHKASPQVSLKFFSLSSEPFTFLYTFCISKDRCAFWSSRLLIKMDFIYPWIIDDFQSRIHFIFQLTEYPCKNTYGVFFLDIPQIFVEQIIIYHGYF